MQFECNTMLQKVISTFFTLHTPKGKESSGKVLVFRPTFHTCMAFPFLGSTFPELNQYIQNRHYNTRKDKAYTYHKLNMKTGQNTILSYNWLEQRIRNKFPFQMFEHLSNTISLAIPKTQGLGQDWVYETKDTNLRIELSQ